MDMMLDYDKCEFQNSFLFSRCICCWYTLESPRRGRLNVNRQHMSFQRMTACHNNFFLLTFQIF